MQRLGQHFLKNKSAIKKIVAALDLRSGDTVVEIGPGHGELTREIFNFQFSIFKKNKTEFKIIAIERDGELAKKLAGNFQCPIINFQKNISKKNLNEPLYIIEGDALKILPKLLSDLKIENLKLKICGNIPYYITGKLLRILSEPKNKPSLCVFTIQKEVAERICARPPKMNRLAAITQFWAEPKILFKLSPDDFSPPPEVESSVIKLEERREKIEGKGIGAENYYKTVKVLFAQPRKTILNNLTAQEERRKKKEEIFKKLVGVGIKPTDRPQNLGVGDIEKISNASFYILGSKTENF